MEAQITPWNGEETFRTPIEQKAPLARHQPSQNAETRDTGIPELLEQSAQIKKIPQSKKMLIKKFTISGGNHSQSIQEINQSIHPKAIDGSCEDQN